VLYYKLHTCKVLSSVNSDVYFKSSEHKNVALKDAQLYDFSQV